MIPDLIKQHLKSSWGDQASALDCYAWVKFTDSEGLWDCYIFSMNPENEDEIMCIIDSVDLEITDWTMTELVLSYQHMGQEPLIDTEFRRQRVNELYKRLREER